MFIKSEFIPHRWFKNRHLQTILGAAFRKSKVLPQLSRYRLELSDGDFIDVDIHINTAIEKISGKKSPTVLVLHGLEGSTDSHYIQGLLSQLFKDDNSVVVMHFRSCSGESNRLL